MTVKELIDYLKKIDDKTLEIYWYDLEEWMVKLDNVEKKTIQKYDVKQKKQEKQKVIYIY